MGAYSVTICMHFILFLSQIAEQATLPMRLTSIPVTLRACSKKCARRRASVAVIVDDDTNGSPQLEPSPV